MKKIITKKSHKKNNNHKEKNNNNDKNNKLKLFFENPNTNYMLHHLHEKL